MGASRETLVDPETEMASWNVIGLPRAKVREEAKDLILHAPVGAFLIRFGAVSEDFKCRVVQPRTINVCGLSTGCDMDLIDFILILFESSHTHLLEM